jgi:hypothetical protein
MESSLAITSEDRDGDGLKKENKNSTNFPSLGEGAEQRERTKN